MDLQGLSMSELIAKHNEMAAIKGIASVTEFKNLKAARTAVENLEKKMTEQSQTATAEDGTTTHTAAVAGEDNSKYNSSGKRGPNQGIGAFCKAEIVAGKNNAEILEMVKAQFPDAKTTVGCVAFYRTALSKAGKEVGPTPEVLRAQAQALLDKATAAEAAAAEAEAAANEAADAQPALV